MTSQPDYYGVLRVRPTASQQEIARAYRALMRTHHPDLGDGAAEDRGDPYGGELLQIMQAFDVLRDPVRRTAYDRSRNRTAVGDAGPVAIPVRRVDRRAAPGRSTIRITPVRWESGPWAGP